MPFHNVPANPEAQPCSANSFRGEKRFENPQDRFARHARAGIGNGKDKPVSAGFLVAAVPCTQEQLSPLRAHCIDRVPNEIA